jgi:predicted transcriptional regulator
MSATNNNYLRPTVIYHLMDEGIATVKKLAELSGLTNQSIQRTVQKLIALNVICRTGIELALTHQGMLFAQCINAEQVEFAVGTTPAHLLAGRLIPVE